ncbi:MAG: hypothetical protein ABI863_02555 [Ginsengibacter sp.]
MLPLPLEQVAALSGLPGGHNIMAASVKGNPKTLIQPKKDKQKRNNLKTEKYGKLY